MTSNNDEALNFYGYSSYEQLEQALLEQGYGLDDVSVRIDSMRQDYEQQKHDALERVVHKKEIRTIKMEELRNEVEQLKEGQMMEIVYNEKPIHSPQDAVEILGNEIKDYDREVLCVLNLDAHGVVQNANIVSMGTVNQTVSSPREIFKSAILSNAHSIILMHNHPSGSVKPSRQDLLMTRRMKEAGELIGIFVKDHIIIGGRTGESYSFREHELIKPFSDTKIAAEEKNVKEETAEYIIPKKKKSKQRGR